MKGEFGFFFDDSQLSKTDEGKKWFLNNGQLSKTDDGRKRFFWVIVNYQRQMKGTFVFFGMIVNYRRQIAIGIL